MPKGVGYGSKLTTGTKKTKPKGKGGTKKGGMK
jgi:hypothetical protein